MVFYAALSFSLNLSAAEVGPSSAVTTHRVDYLEVTRPNVKLHVPDIGVTYEVSNRLPLIQQTQEHYIAGVERFDGSLQPAAFPLTVSRKQGAAWVTNDKFMIFANRTASTAGLLELEDKETLKILSRHADHYEVELSRYGRSVVLRIPNGMEGITLKQKEVMVRTQVPINLAEEDVQKKRINKAQSKNTQAKPGRRISVSLDEAGMRIEDSHGNVVHNNQTSINAESAAAMQSAQINFLPPASPKPAAPESAVKRQDSTAQKQVIQELKEVVMLEIVAELQKSKSQLSRGTNPGSSLDSQAVSPSGDGLPAAEAESAGVSPEVDEVLTVSNLASRLGSERNSELAATLEHRVKEATQALDQAAAGASAAAIMDHPDFQQSDPAYLRFLNSNSLMFQILLGVCLLEGVLLFNMRLKNRKKEEQQPQAQSEAVTYSYNISGEAMISQPDPEVVQASEGDLSGTLDGYSIGQVVQFFNSSGDDGILVLMADGGEEDTMIFNNGQIIAATSGDLTGDEAVYAILRRQQGSFCFRRTDTADHERLILQDTMSLLLEGHRLVDELGFDAA